MVAPTDSRPKDFAFIKKDGVYHLFYIRHNDFLPPFATENDFGHAVSTDLYRWQQLPAVLPVDPFGWDNLHVWAPHIIEAGGLYWMFYTGVTEKPGEFSDTQRIGVAVSSDLMTWNRPYVQPVWENRLAPWAWWRPLNAYMSCRDPFVMADPAAPGQYLMYYTASLTSDSLATVVGVARSPNGDMAEWVDDKPLMITHRSLSFNTLTESPHLFAHNGRWFMFITANAGQPLSFYTTADPLAEPAQWIYRGRLRNMLGFDTRLWFASESLRDGDHDLFAFAAADRIELRRIEWGTGDNFSLTEPAFFHVVDMNWTRPSVQAGDPVGLRLRTSNWFAFQQQMKAFVRLPSGVELPAPLDSLGLPVRPVFRSDSTVVTCFPRRWPSTLAPSEPMVVRLALDDGTASTPWLTVSDAPRGPVPPGGRGDTLGDVPEREFPPPVAQDSVVFDPARAVARAAAPRAALTARTLRQSPLGLALTFELAAGADVRVEVFDLQGRRVRVLAERGFERGAHVLPWDGRDDSGVRAGRGLYFVRFSTPAHTASTRVLLER